MLTGKEVTESSLTERGVHNLFKSSNNMRNADLDTFKILF